MNLKPYIDIARIDHWFKNVFALPGVLLAVAVSDGIDLAALPIPLVLAFGGLCLTASSNYVINEYLDAETDRQHPIKKDRPAARGDVTGTGVVIEWLALAATGLAMGFAVSVPTGLTLTALWVMGIVYNVRPMRSKEQPYVDVLSEAVNNPLRLLLGWFATGTALWPPASLLLSYWMLGAYLMAVKRYAEYRQIGDPAAAAAYRRSFAWYDEERLLVSVMAYACACALFAGMFIIRYKIELVLAVPLVAGFFAMYLHVGMMPNSAAIKPESLYQNKPLMAYSLLTFAVCVVLLVVQIDGLAELFTPTIPTLE